MFNLVYESTANSVFEQSQVQDMLEHARDFNSRNKITGCLLYYHGAFLQYLEGDQSTVLKLFERIKEDDRHSQVILLSSSHIYSREFDTWSMAYENFLGANHQLEYLKLLISSYMEVPKTAISPNPTSKRFWTTAKKLLNFQLCQKFK